MVTRHDVLAAWAALAGLASLEGVQVIVGPGPPFGPPGWMSVLVLDATVTACAPTAECAADLARALDGLTPEQSTSVDHLLPRLPGVSEWLGPDPLFYALDTPPEPDPRVATASVAELARLLDAVSPEDLDESGIQAITSPAFVWREQGQPVAACGFEYRPPWGPIAHLCVLTHPGHRRRGLGLRAAKTALATQHARD